MPFELTVKDGDKSYTIKENEVPPSPWTLLLENEDGEGMSISDKNLFDILDNYFKTEF